METTSIHNSQMPSVSPPSAANNYLAGFLKILPVLQWGLTIACAVAFFILATRDAQTVQASEINRIVNEQKATRDLMTERKNERDKQVEELKRIMLTKDIFDAYHQNDVQRMERIEKMLQQILEKPERQ